MTNSKYIKILSNITYDRGELESFYNSVKDNLEIFYDIHTETDDPYLRCVCKTCSSFEPQHQPGGHLTISNLEQYKNKEILRIKNKLKYLTVRNLILWVYKPNYILRPHKDFFRTATIIMPILPTNDSVGVDIYRSDLPIISNIPYHNDEYLIETYKYNTKHPTVLNSGSMIHGFRNNNHERVILYVSCNLPWNKI